MSMTRTRLIVAALLALTSVGNAQQPDGKYQSCRGVLTEDQGVYLLIADPGAGDWCDADIIAEYVGADAVNRVLSVCKVGGRCHIKGRFYNGRRVVWSAITYIVRLP
jgi:hypothetical protein